MKKLLFSFQYALLLRCPSACWLKKAVNAAARPVAAQLFTLFQGMAVAAVRQLAMALSRITQEMKACMKLQAMKIFPAPRPKMVAATRVESQNLFNVKHKHMKSNILFLAVILISISACVGNHQEPVSVEIAAETQTVPHAKPKGVIPTDAMIYQFAQFSDKYDWKDVDAYYRYEVLQKEKEQDYFNSLKNLTFGVLVNAYQMPDFAPTDVVAYYIDEQAAMSHTPFVREFVGCLEKMRGHWPDSKIQQAAQMRYEKTKQHYLSTSWSTKWELEKTKYEPLLVVR